MASSDNVLNNIGAFGSQMTKPDDAMQYARDITGVGGAQQASQGLRGVIGQTQGLLNQVAPGVMGRVSNSLVTSNQANRQIQNESAPLQQQLAGAQKAYDSANTDYDALTKQAENRGQATLDYQKGQMSYLQQLYNEFLQKEQSDRALADQRYQFDTQLATSRM